MMALIDAGKDRSRGEHAVASTPPYLIYIYIATILFPSTTVFFIGPILLTPQKLFITLAFLPVLYIFLSTRKIMIFDYIYFFYIFWFSLSFLLNYGPSRISQVALIVISNISVYCLVQVSIKNTNQYKKIVFLLFVIVLFLGILAVPEMVLKVRYIPELVASITGYSHYYQSDERLGLLRAMTVFQHSILYGLFSASIVSYVWYLSDNLFTRMFAIGVVIAAAFTALSSGPLFAIAVQLILIGIERTTRWLPRRGYKIMLGLIVFYVVMEIASEGPFIRAIIRNLTLTPHTAYYRLLIWDHAMDDILRNPIFGMRVEEWTRLPWMVQSVDNFWLLQTLRGGFPASLALLLTVVFIVRSLFKHPASCLSPEYQKLRYAAAYTLIGYCVCAATVAFFGKIEPLFAFYVGLAAALARMQNENEAVFVNQKEGHSQNAEVKRSRGQSVSVGRSGNAMSKVGGAKPETQKKKGVPFNRREVSGTSLRGKPSSRKSQWTKR